MPCIWLMTDERVAEADLLRAIARLPRGAAIIFRHYGLAKADRRELFERFRKAAQKRGCFMLLAGDPKLARDWSADGHHGGERAPKRGAWLHSAPVHDARELCIARRAGADVILLSPLFVTRSHPDARPLGPVRFAAIARRSTMPVIALGGVRRRHARLVRQLGAAGFAAIDGLTIRRPQSGSPS